MILEESQDSRDNLSERVVDWQNRFTRRVIRTHHEYHTLKEVCYKIKCFRIILFASPQLGTRGGTSVVDI